MAKINKRQNVEQYFNKASLYLFSIIGTFFGAILMFNSVNISKFLIFLDASFLYSMGQLIITIFFGSLLMEWFGYVNYTRKRMCEILVEDEVIKVLDIDRKKELKSALIKNIYMDNAPSLQNEENNIVDIIDKEMDNILRDYYYDEYIIYIDASIFNHSHTA